MERGRNRCAPRVCGDDPVMEAIQDEYGSVLPAYAGMILDSIWRIFASLTCSPRMRG